jgi:predicted ATP-grasp superfamily ATP-dependent carboligase
MRYFVYEFITGGGLLVDEQAAPPSLLAEGRAMLAAASADFAMLANAEVWVMRDGRLPSSEQSRARVFPITSTAQEQELFRRLAAEADWTLLIAPETGGELLRRCQLVEAYGGRLLSPSAECARLATNKQRTAELLSRRGVRIPTGHLLAEGTECSQLPLVAKPVDGCGSQGVRLVRTSAEAAALPVDGTLRLEPYIPGLPASVSVLCGPAGQFALPAGEQILAADGTFQYLGGRLPLDALSARRAQAIALAAVAALPNPRGYVGVDLVLGEEADGSQDFVIEINPRLTTSYVGLRAASRTNLAAAMIAVCEGKTPDLCFSQRQVEFTADGRIGVSS